MRFSFLLSASTIFLLCTSCGGGETATSDDNDAPIAPMVSDPADMMPAAITQSWSQAMRAYLGIKDALVASDLAGAKAMATEFATALAGADMAAMGESHDTWMSVVPRLSQGAVSIGQAQNLEIARKEFYALTEPVVAAVKTFGEGGQDLYVQHCPMAIDNAGANWVSAESNIRNPYFGDKMLTCGKVVEEL